MYDHVNILLLLLWTTLFSLMLANYTMKDYKVELCSKAFQGFFQAQAMNHVFL